MSQGSQHGSVPQTSSGGFVPQFPRRRPKQFVRPNGSDGFDPKSIHGLILSDCVQQDYDPQWKCPSEADKATRDLWFQRFEGIAEWDSHDTAEVRRMFKKVVNNKISDKLKDFRKSGRIPSFFKGNIEGARQLKHFYDTDEEYLKKREKARANAAGAGSGGPTRHRLGPKEITYWIDRLTRENNGVPILPSALFKQVMMDKNGGFLNENGSTHLAQIELMEREWCENNMGEHMPTAELMRIWEAAMGKGQRSGLPKNFRATALQVEGSQYYRPLTQHQPPAQNFDPGDLDVLVAASVADAVRPLREEWTQHTRRLDDLGQGINSIREMLQASQVYRPTPPPTWSYDPTLPPQGSGGSGQHMVPWQYSSQPPQAPWEYFSHPPQQRPEFASGSSRPSNPPQAQPRGGPMGSNPGDAFIQPLNEDV